MPRPSTLAVFGALLAAAVAAASQAGSAAGSRASAPICSAAQLQGKRLDSNGAAGTILISITLKNVGAACSFKGYPALQIRGAHGTLPTRVVHGGLAVLNSKPKLVTLRRLGRASVLVSYSDVPVGSEGACPHGTALRLRPPRDDDWLSVGASTFACGHGTLHVSPMLAGIRHAA